MKWVDVKDRFPEHSGFYIVWSPLPGYPECNFRPAFFIARKEIFVVPDGSVALKAERWMAVYRPEGLGKQ